MSTKKNVLVGKNTTVHEDKTIVYLALRIRPLKDKNNAPVIMELLLKQESKNNWQLPHLFITKDVSIEAAILSDLTIDHEHRQVYLYPLTRLENKTTIYYIALLKEKATPSQSEWFSLFMSPHSILLSSGRNIIQYKSEHQIWNGKSEQQLSKDNVLKLCQCLSQFREQSRTSTLFFHLLKEPFTITRAIKVHDLITGIPITREMYMFRYLQHTQLLYQEKGGRRTKYFRYAME